MYAGFSVVLQPVIEATWKANCSNSLAPRLLIECGCQCCDLWVYPSKDVDSVARDAASLNSVTTGVRALKINNIIFDLAKLANLANIITFPIAFIVNLFYIIINTNKYSLSS